MSEYEQFRKKYPKFSFNDKVHRRNKGYYLFCVETHTIRPSNYNLNIIKNYKGVITWNKKFYEQNKDKINIHYLYGFPLFDNYFNLTDFVDFKDKINGVSLMCRYRTNNNKIDKSNDRLRVLQEINSTGKLTCHCFGKSSYGGKLYKGVVGNLNKIETTYPSSLSKLQKLNQYKFNLCFENCYHELWSWDYITEKIRDCFRAKTIPIYWGCYNIENHIPKELFIDYRDFKDTNNLVEYCLSIDETKYNKMVNDAYEFDKNFKMGDVKGVTKLFGELK